jgi:hypothetical protein
MKNVSVSPQCVSVASYCLHSSQHTDSFHPNDGGETFLQNAGSNNSHTESAQKTVFFILHLPGVKPQSSNSYCIHAAKQSNSHIADTLICSGQYMMDGTRCPASQTVLFATEPPPPPTGDACHIPMNGPIEPDSAHFSSHGPLSAATINIVMKNGVFWDVDAM